MVSIGGEVENLCEKIRSIAEEGHVMARKSKTSTVFGGKSKSNLKG